MDFSLRQVRPLVTQGSYFDYTPQPSSSNSSPDSINNPLQLGNTTASSDIDPTGQTWDSVDFELFDFDSYDLANNQDQQITSPDAKESNTPKSKARRRAQNRASQRAFRERKERHVKGLEYQLETLNEKHQDLLASYSKQASNITKLNGRIAQLQARIRATKLANEQASQASNTQVPDSFDAFAFTGDAAGPMLYAGEELSFEDNAADVTSPASPDMVASLPLFEDLLLPLS
ncbi:hypothetical protein LTR10_016171 [Elasticomyces elasticus]|uniref:BZIP domain-containing protein n=1 Tax=Exophiala sideris TaxID=1016849 RepID=A0ABR0JGL8_9EURO|nr:hypothetical protein LTR10_016171 [Elasticomyces elasticus]KAK5027617.1 hypothetical protein LTR13_009550 [Exophiala sideris]KAK5032820.1 hypothetical protein LTS07_004230 [Exophiala sideris]KAK5062344.1 hypothetical protein LTR69_004702 [Exophiala sideris]KAK5177502.1 hypothetical protein LTR44_009912 [Eurotiomycetes sp. CCFEE 6388]